MAISLRDLYEAVHCGEAWERELKQATSEQTRLQQRVKEAEKRLFAEQSDVTRLEKKNVANALYRLSGKWAERVERERGDVHRARAEAEQAAAALEQCTQRVEALKRQLMQLRESRQTLTYRLEAKRMAIRQGTGDAATELACRERVLQDYCQRLKELAEADRAGRQALMAADQVLRCLEGADGWATWDLVGGGLVADLAKHSRLDEAQQHMAALQNQLRQFNKELGDVAIRADIQVNVEGFLRAADYWFDNLFTDWTVKHRIEESLRRVHNLRSEIQCLLTQMEAMKNETQRREAFAQQELEQWLVDA